jgi:hypothetical protein
MPNAAASRAVAALIAGLSIASSGYAEPATASASASSQVYRVELSADWSRLTVEACFFEDLPKRLHAGSDEAYKYLEAPGIRHGAQTLAPSQGALSVALESESQTACLQYSVAVRAAADASRREGRTQSGDTLVVAPGLWLWRPAQLPNDALLQFELPQGINVSAPWPILQRRGNVTQFRLTNTPPRWPARTAIGRFPIREIAVGGATLHLAILDASPPADDAAVTAWLDEAARAVTTLYGRFPLSQAQLLLTPIGRQPEPVPWGQVLRGGRPAAHLFFDQTRPSREWRDDWTAVHELAHMLLPYISRRDAWLSEGFATYYQNVLRARAGLISETDAWRKLVAGFGRGQSGTQRGISLDDASRAMRRERAFMRVYWSGAAIALLADTQLRQSHAGMSLDEALSRLARCCLPSPRMWTARQAFERMDELTGNDVFVALAEQYRSSDQFPDVDDLLLRLGVIGRGDTLSLDDDAELAPLRRALMRTPPEPPAH